MTGIHLCTANISGPISSRTTVDLVDWLAAGFADVGIALSVDAKQFRGDTPNIVVEGFNAPFKPFLDQHRGKIKLICFVTEAIDGEAFDVAPGTMDGAERYRQFMSLADHYSGFLTTVPDNIPLLNKIAPTSYFEFGFTERLLRLSSPDQWKHDYCFSGSLTPYRRQMIEEISAVLPLHIPGGTSAGHTATAISVDDYLASVSTSAVNLGIKQHPTWKLPSGSRVARILHSGTGCVVERTEVTTRQSAFVPTFDSAGDLKARFWPVDRAKIHQETMDRLASYRTGLPLKAEVERNLAECPALTS